MKNRFLSVCILAMCAANALADGSLILVNRFLPLPDGSNYHVPVWVDLNGNGVRDSGEGIGAYAAAIGQRATLGLYLRGETTPLATSLFRTDNYGEFLGVPGSQDVMITGYAPGQSAPLTIKVWVGASYEDAIIRGSWDFTSAPLGGTPLDGGVPLISPTPVGWGSVDGSGYALVAPAGPIAGTDTLVRRTIADARASIQSLLANDSDAGGSPITFVGVDPISNSGSGITVVDGDIVYHRFTPAPDFFFYTIRNSSGGVSRGRVNVALNDPEGLIRFSNRNIPKVDNSAGYDVPIFVDADFDGLRGAGENVGTFARNYYGTEAKLGLFVKNSDVALVVAPFRIDALAAFTAGDPQLVAIPGVAPGAQVELTLKAWIGESFETALVKKTWDFISLPLGGSSDTVALPIPGLTGWGSENNEGLALPAGPPPVANLDEMFRKATADGAITIGTLLSNDTDPEGSALTFVGVDRASNAGADLEVSNGSIIYRHTFEAPDYFFYTIRNARGAIAKGRVDVKINGPVIPPIFSPVFIPVTIGDVVSIPIEFFLPEGGFQFHVIRFDDWTTNGIGIIYFNNAVTFDSAVLANDSFTITFANATSVATREASLQVQDGPAKIFLSNRMVRRSFGAGVYNVPVWIDTNFNGVRDRGEGIGSIASKQFGQTATLGLFVRGGATPLATARFHTDDTGAFLEEPAFQQVIIPNAAPGTPADLTLKAWIGDSYESSALKGEWDFTAKQLGGLSRVGGFDIPDLSGWGDETNNIGYAITPGAKPRAYGAVITRQPGQNASIKVSDMIKNDSDPDGGALTLVSVDENSKLGGAVSLLANTVYYTPALQDNGAPDYFEYTIRNSKGGMAKGRVDVVVTDAQGQFNTLLSIENVGGTNQISFRGVIGSNYTVQYRDTLDADWQALGIATNEGFGLFKISDSNAVPSRFYRVITN